MNTPVETWYAFSLQQIAAESYLDRLDLNDRVALGQRLRLGNNNFAPIVYVNGEARPNRLLERYPPDPDLPILPGATRMTATQAQYFLDRYRIVHQHANDPSGFSATLIQTGRFEAALGSGSVSWADNGNRYRITPDGLEEKTRVFIEDQADAA